MAEAVGPGLDELAARVQQTDPVVLRASAAGLDDAADELDRECRLVRGHIDALSRAWRGAAYLSWADAATTLAARLAQSAWALRRMAALLRRLADACTEAQFELRGAYGVLDTMAYAGGAQDQVRAHAVAVARAACDRYHAVERSVREELWDIGDGAPGAAPPGTPRILRPPELPWWQTMIGLTRPKSYWVDRFRSPYDPHATLGVDEDGRLVPAYRGAPVPSEPTEIGQDAAERGLVELVFATVKRLGKRPRLSVPEAQNLFADTIRSSYGWRAEHITKHIREWYNLGRDEPVPEWMREDYLNTVTEACARADRVFAWKLRGGNETFGVIWRDYRTKRDIMVEFYATGNKGGLEFATSFRPTAAQTDATLRAPRVVIGE